MVPSGNIETITIRNWSKEQISYLIKNYGKLSYGEMSIFLNKSSSTIKKIAKKIGIVEKKNIIPAVWTEEKDDFLVENYGKITYNEMSEILGKNYSFAAIQYRIKILGIQKKGKGNNCNFKHIQGRKVNKFDENFFDIPNILNSYWAGFIAADGNIRKNERHVSIQLHQRDACVLENLVKEVGFTGTISYYTRKNGIPMCNVHFNSTRWVENLKKYFSVTPQKTYTLQPPKLINEEFIDAFIIGYIDGDGCIRYRDGKYNNHLRLSIVGTKGLLEWMKKRFNIILQKENRKLLMGNISKKCAVYQLSLGGRYVGRTVLEHLNTYEVPKLERKWGKI